MPGDVRRPPPYLPDNKPQPTITNAYASSEYRAAERALLRDTATDAKVLSSILGQSGNRLADLGDVKLPKPWPLPGPKMPPRDPFPRLPRDTDIIVD